MVLLKIYIFILINTLGICEAVEYDYHAETLVRPYPLGVYLKGQTGLNIPIWTKKDTAPFLYGLIRPSLEAKTSAKINTASAQIEILPISFLSLYAGLSRISRKHDKLDTFNCQAIACESDNMQRKFWGAKLGLKVREYWAMINLRWSSADLKDRPNLNYAEEQGSLIGAAGGDILYSATPIIGIEIKNKFSLGILHKYNSMRSFNNNSSMNILFARKEWKKWALLAGPGIYHTRNNSNVFTTLLILRWNGHKGDYLF
jgi:hypothetical protein